MPPHRPSKALRMLPAAATAVLLAAPAAAQEDQLALTRVMLSTGGVGYFEYEATVTGDATLDFEVPLDQVDDVLKSVVVYDSQGGVGEISLPGREPLREVFREMPFGPDALTSPVALLNALRGAEVRAIGSREISGRIIAVTEERTQLPNNGGEIVRHRVSLSTGDGVRQFVLEETDTLQFADPELQADLDAALAALTLHNQRDRRTLTIRTTGAGERTLRVAYVVEAPLWKTSYRLTVSADPAAETADLQGWAVLENLSGEDWDGVDLTVVSGNPVTFRQALYDVYYVARPEIPVEVAGRVLPRVDERGRPAERDQDDGAVGAGLAMPAPSAEMAAAEPMLDRMATVAQDIAVLQYGGDFAQLQAAESSEAATQVVFHLPEPVSVASGHSLLVPVIDREVPAELVSLYQMETHQTHPLASVRLTNDGETGLPPGVLTLYERAAASGEVSYIGDARLGALPAGEERLVSFAVDQKVTIDREETSNDLVSRARIVDGVLEITHTRRSTTRYSIIGPAREERTVLVDSPRYDGWTLIEPDAASAEIVGSNYRIRRDVPAGETEILEVVQEQPWSETLVLVDAAPEQIGYYAQANEIPAEVRQALSGLAGQLAEIRDARAELDRLEQRRSQVTQDQGRVRDNLEAVPQDSDLYQRYLTKLSQQETELEGLVAEIESARTAMEAARQRFIDAVRKLNV